MVKFIEGKLTGKDLEFCIIVSRFNSLVTERLLEGALDAFERSETKKDKITVVKTPGAFEIPATIKKVLKTGKFDGIICLGAVIRGETPHFDYVSAEAVKGIASAGLEAEIPVIMGVLTTDTVEQALDRAGAKTGNKGFDAARSVIEMANLYKEIG
ncbi:MAG: 6,7-dimethyl-8-ribityllumazine synthase [Myxococcota bacterium]